MKIKPGSTIEATRAALNQLRGAVLQEMATKLGVPVATLYRIRSGETANPGYPLMHGLQSELAARRVEAPNDEAPR